MLFNKTTILVIFSIIYMVSLAIIYLSKDRIRNQENTIYMELVFVNIFGLFFQLFLEVVTKNMNVLPEFLISLILKIYSAHFIVYLALITKYLVFLSTEKHFKLIENFRKIFFYVSIVVIFFLPVKLFFDPETLDAYSYGTGIDFTFMVSFITDMILVAFIVIRRKKITTKKCIPLIIFVIFGTICGYIQQQSPSITLIGCAESLVCFLMFHTIENPDKLMIEELTKAQRLSEKSSNEKSNFVNVVRDDVTARLENAEVVYNNVMALNPDENVTNEMFALRDIIMGARNMLNSAMGISDSDNRNIQITNNKYNVKLLFNSVYSQKKNDVKNDVDFRLNISDDLPLELYGDSIKLKQILSSILDNAAKYTEKGFIELRVNSLVKNNICRLIVSVEDSGTGMDIYKQNEIMNDNHDLETEDIDSLNDMNLNLKVVRKMVMVLGGNFTIDNNKYGGTTINISLDQKISEEIKSKEEEQIAKYSDVVRNQKTCAIITMNNDSSKVLKSVFKKKNYKLFDFNVAKNCLDNIRNNNEYTIIFIDEDMEKINARAFIKKVKEVEGFNSKVYVISKNREISNRKELLDLGFAGIVYTPIDKKDLIKKIEL